MTLAAIAGKLLGADGFDAYPALEVGSGATTLALSALIVLSGLAPLRRRPRRGLVRSPSPRPSERLVPEAPPRPASPRPSRSTASPTPIREAAAAALRDVSLELARGEFALLAGRSASGKSTLLRAACGLVPHFHGGEIAGRVEVAGLDAIESGPGELASVGRLRRPGPGDPGRLDHGRRRDRAAAGDARRPPDLPRPRGRGGRPRAGDPAPARAAPSTRSPAASCNAWPWPRRS